MYVLTGRHSNPRALAELAPRLEPKRSAEGYATTDRERTRALFAPLLGDVFPGEWHHCALAIIWPNGTIPPHEDGASEFRQRFMLVLQSNPGSWVWHDGDWQQLEEGGIYTADPSKTHAALNWGSEPRIHFVVDVK